MLAGVGRTTLSLDVLAGYLRTDPLVWSAQLSFPDFVVAGSDWSVQLICFDFAVAGSVEFLGSTTSWVAMDVTF